MPDTHRPTDFADALGLRPLLQWCCRNCECHGNTMVKGSVPGQSQRRCFGSVAPPTVSRGVVGGAVDSAAIVPAITSVTWISIEAGRTRDRDLTGAASEPRRLAASLS